MTERRPANSEMVQGYLDGLDLSSPDPSDNRSTSYRHGFQMGRNDRHHTAGAGYHHNVKAAVAAMDEDERR